MLAGVGGIDLALLVVAANEGVMPQTREHLTILDLLGVRRGLVVITKKDLVDEEWLSLVTLEVEELIKPTVLSGAPIVAVSALTGEGLPRLVSTIDQLLSATEPRKDIGRPRLPIDRIFAISGSGTVVTGTLIDGSLSRGQEVEIVPPGLKSRLRELQTHKARIETASPGSRVAANLVGIATSQLKRGDVLTSPGWLAPTTILDARLRLLPGLRRPLRHNATVSFHTGAAEVMAKVRMLEKERLEPGDTGWAQLILAETVAVVKGDHFIIRSTTDTLGGGTVVEPHATRHRRFRSAVIQGLETQERGTAEEVMMAILESRQPIEWSALLARCDLPPSEAQPAIEHLLQQQDIVGIGQGEDRLLFSTSGWKSLAAKATAIVQDYHRRFPARPGMPKAEVASKLKLGPRQFISAVKRLAQEGILVEKGASVHLPAFEIQLTPEQQAKIDAFLRSLARNPYAPPSELIPEPDLLDLLVDEGRVVKISDSVVFAAATYDEMVRRITAHIKERGKVTLAEVRDMFNTSRKYAQALLEYMDEKQVTRRVGDERVLR
jgi:selenocysteine-specific elongation factor